MLSAHKKMSPAQKSVSGAHPGGKKAHREGFGCQGFSEPYWVLNLTRVPRKALFYDKNEEFLPVIDARERCGEWSEWRFFGKLISVIH